jgi:hypothetical protein
MSARLESRRSRRNRDCLIAGGKMVRRLGR